MINVDTSIFETPSAINIKTTEEKGREYIANQLIEKEATLLKVYPYATAIFDSFKKRICAYCLCTHPSKSFSTHCLGCDQVYFCSSACAHIYLRNHNDGICESLRKLATLKKVDKNMKSVGKLILMIYWERNKEINQQHEQLSMDQSNNKKMTIGFDLVDQLESHYDKWSLDIKKDWMRLHTFLLKQLHQLQWLLPHESDIDIMHLASKIESNGFGIYLEKKLDILAGRAIYPLASLFNHDCNFNCEVEQWTEECLEDEKVKLSSTDDSDDDHGDNDDSNNNKENGNDKGDESIFVYPSIFNQTHGKFRQMFIRTIRQVQDGEALTIGYIDTNLPVSSRRQRLLQDYYFTCQCNKCIEESNQIASSKKKKNKMKR